MQKQRMRPARYSSLATGIAVSSGIVYRWKCEGLRNRDFVQRGLFERETRDARTFRE
jgi:hypothetical protein